jgi:hypothetical protein
VSVSNLIEPSPAPGQATVLPSTESVSVVVLVSERPQSLTELYHEYAAPLRKQGVPFEFLFVLDAQWRGLAGAVAQLARSGEQVRVFELAHTVGETALLKQAVSQTTGTILVTLPPYPRVMPEALPGLVEKVAQGADLVMARRWPRHDSWINRAQNRALHILMRPLLGRGIHDVACGVRAMRPRVVEESTMYGDFLRFLPFLAMRQGFQVVEIPSPQHPADVHARVYAPRTYLSRLLDVLALFVLLRFAEKPLRFFGTVGSLTALVGTVLLGVIFTDKLGGQSIANRPLLLLAGLLVVIGIEAVALGLIGELIVYLYTRHVGRRPVYRIRERTTSP